MGQGNIITANWQYSAPTAGDVKLGSELDYWHCASSYSLLVEVLQASTEPSGGSRLRSSSGASGVRLRSLPFEFMFTTSDYRVRRLLFIVLGVVHRRSAGEEVCIGR